MKDSIKFLIFIGYTIVVFFVIDYRMLAIMAGIQILLMIGLNINLKQAIKNILSISVFIVFTMLINLLVGTIEEAVLIGIRLVIICNATYIFSKTMTILRIAKVIETLVSPLKLLKVNPESIGLMISIGMAFVPIIRQEMIQIKYALKAKGFDTRFFCLVTNMNLIMAPLFISLLRKVNEIEYTLRSKAYID